MSNASLDDVKGAIALGVIDLRYCVARGLGFEQAEGALRYLNTVRLFDVALSPRFDPAVYRARYPDITAEPIHPVTHYVRSGQQEGRQAFPVFDFALKAAQQAQRPLWIESHDLSLTGAPLALSHVLMGWPELAGAAVLGSPSMGPLEARFRDLGCAVVPHAQGARRVYTMQDRAEIVARSRVLLERSGVRALLANSFLAWPMVMAARQLGLPTTWIVHEPDTEEVRQVHAEDVFEDAQKLLTSVRRLVFVSDASRRAWGADDLAHARVVEKVIPPYRPGNRADARRAANCAPEDILILSIGSLSPRKGQMDLVDALATLADKPIAQHLVTVIVGYHPSPYAQQVLAKLQALRARGMRLIMLAESKTEKDRRIVEHLFYAADIFTMTSRSESLPITTAEALAAHCPVISTDGVGIGEMVKEGVTGHLYTAGDYGRLATFIEALAKNPDIREKMRKEIGEIPRGKGFSDMISRYRRLLEPIFELNF